MSPLDLQRIVDGELDHAARAEILRSLGEDARAWRSLALSLLEDQQWSRGLRRELFRDDSGSELSAGGASLRIAPQTLISTSGSAVTPFKKNSFRSSWFTALAASVTLFIGLASGVLMRSLREGDSMARIVAPLQDGTRDSATTAENSPRSERDLKLPMKMVLTGTGRSENTPLEIPVVEASKIDPEALWAREARELAKLQQKLKREGYRMEWEPRLYSGRLNDGRQVVVPVHNVALKSVGL